MDLEATYRYEKVWKSRKMQSFTLPLFLFLALCSLILVLRQNPILKRFGASDEVGPFKNMEEHCKKGREEKSLEAKCCTKEMYNKSNLARRCIELADRFSNKRIDYRRAFLFFSWACKIKAIQKACRKAVDLYRQRKVFSFWNRTEPSQKMLRIFEEVRKYETKACKLCVKDCSVCNYLGMRMEVDMRYEDAFIAYHRACFGQAPKREHQVTSNNKRIASISQKQRYPLENRREGCLHLSRLYLKGLGVLKNCGRANSLFKDFVGKDSCTGECTEDHPCGENGRYTDSVGTQCLDSIKKCVNNRLASFCSKPLNCERELQKKYQHWNTIKEQYWPPNKPPFRRWKVDNHKYCERRSVKICQNGRTKCRDKWKYNEAKLKSMGIVRIFLKFKKKGARFKLSIRGDGVNCKEFKSLTDSSCFAVSEQKLENYSKRGCGFYVIYRKSGGRWSTEKKISYESILRRETVVIGHE